MFKVQKRNKKRVNVYLEGTFAFALFATNAARLRVGQWLSDSEIEVLQAADGKDEAYARALHFISYRPRSTQEVRRRLAEKSFSDTMIETTLERLQRAELLDDLEFARYWVEQRQQFRPRSTTMLRYELRQKGVHEETIAAALEMVDDEETAYQAAHQWAQRPSNLTQKDVKRKLSAYLARRGFSYSVARDAIARLQDENQVPGGRPNENGWTR